MALISRISSAVAMAAALSMAATPAVAADISSMPAGASLPTASGWDAEAVNADGYRYGRYGRYRRNRVDAGDVLAGVLIIGGIAAIASAASNSSKRDRDYRERDYRDRPYNYRTNTSNPRSSGSNGINSAVDMCLREIERDVRVDGVDSVDRNASGWLVTGRLYNGDGFTCRIGSDGRVEGVNYSGRSLSQAGGVEDRQWDDDRYAQARQNADGAGGATPAYPGGPVDGDLYPGGTYQPNGG
ncbi:MAG: hypothetical protein H6918_11030 [Sphingomonadaceae bacterium]|nr:hypothetical protein [Sphingomonadaceae bacterium]